MHRYYVTVYVTALIMCITLSTYMYTSHLYYVDILVTFNKLYILVTFTKFYILIILIDCLYLNVVFVVPSRKRKYIT